MKQNSRSERADPADMYPDFNLHKRRVEGFEHTHTCMYTSCCAENEVAAEEQLMVISSRILSAGVKTVAKIGTNASEN